MKTTLFFVLLISILIVLIYYSKKEEKFTLLKNLKPICSKYKLKYILERSNKMTKNDYNTGRYIVMVFTSNPTIIKTMITKIGFNSAFKPFVSKILSEHKSNLCGFGIDPKTNAQKVYISCTDETINTIEKAYCMEIKGDKIQNKIYAGIDYTKTNLLSIMYHIFPHEFSNKFSKIFKKYQQWGYCRYVVSKGKHKLQGVDFSIQTSIKNIKHEIMQLAKLINYKYIKKLGIWLNKKENKTIWWLSLNYRKGEVDFCIYYRD